MTISNDNFANSIRLVQSTTSAAGSNVGATGEAGEPDHAGVNYVNFGGDVNSVWYTWVAPASGTVEINTLGSSYDTSLGVYTGSAVNALTTIAGNDDYYGLQSRVTFNATAGQTYRIAVDGYFNRQGTFNLNLDLSPNYTQTGTLGNDFLYGTGANDVIRGLAGDDSIFGNGGNDYIDAGAGNDSLYGGSGNDYIDGGADDDVLYGNGGQDTLLGGGGNDKIYGASQADYIEGGAGDDVIYGNGGKDTLIGGSGNDLIYGGSDADYILGGAGDDTIYGNGGGDFIDSGTGKDTIWLGGGAATVVLTSGDGFDTIKNFQFGQTSFKLGSGLTFANLSFSDSADGAVVTAGSDTIAVISWQNANAINNAANFV